MHLFELILIIANINKNILSSEICRNLFGKRDADFDIFRL